MYFYMLILIPLLLFSGWASAKVNSTFHAFDKLPNRACMTGYDTAVRLMRNRGVNDITVERVNGKLTDHYHPTKRKVNLSKSTYGSASVAAVAVAAHEVGHVMQKKEGYFAYRIRNLLVPIANIGSRLALPLLLVGILLDLFLTGATVGGLQIGNLCVYLAIAFYGASTLFTLVTLPVELNASRRAQKMLVEDGILAPDEVVGAKKVLTAAAMTYLASLFVSLFYFLRFVLIALSFLRRD